MAKKATKTAAKTPAKTTKAAKTPAKTAKVEEKAKREFTRKSALISEVAKKSNVSKKEAETIINSFIESLADTFAEGKSITLQGFGSFLVTEMKARDMRVFGREIHAPERKTVKFKISQSLKSKCND